MSQDVVIQPKTKNAGFSSDPEKAERQIAGLRKGWKAAKARGEQTQKDEASKPIVLTDEEKNRISSRRRQLRKKFRPEQLPLLENYLMIEILQARTLALCFNGGTSLDYQRLNDITKLQLQVAEALEITPKEERKSKPPKEDGVNQMMARLQEAREKQEQWRREEEEALGQK